MRAAAYCTFAVTCAAASLFVLSGCVERTLIIRSNPPGAAVVLNGEDVGSTPLRVPFDTYGTFEVVASHPRHQRLRETVPVKPPWYEQIPLDFFFETVWPLTLRDEHEIVLTLKPVGPAEDTSIGRREQELRERMERGEEP